MSELGLAAQPRNPRHLALRAALEYELGDREAGAAYLARLLDVLRSVPPPGPIGDHVYVAWLLPLVCRIAGSDEGLDVAEAAAERLLALPRLAPLLATVVRSGLGLIAAQRHDATTARALYSALEPQRGTAFLFTPLTSDRLLGLLAVTSGRVDAALAHFADGLAFCDRRGYRPEYAWTAYDYASALRERAGPDDNRRAAELLEEARAIAVELGMRALGERVLTQWRKAPGR
jgi:hypothetical protein